MIIVFWVVILAGSVWLALTFPRHLAVLLVAAALGVGALFTYLLIRRDPDLPEVAITAALSALVCADPDHPLAVTIVNAPANPPADGLTFAVQGFRPGQRSPVAHQYLTVERTIAPGETWSSCFAMPPLAQLRAGETPQVLEWRAEATLINWR